MTSGLHSRQYCLLVIYILCHVDGSTFLVCVHLFLSELNFIAQLQPAGGQSNILFGEVAEVKVPKKIHDQKFAELTGTDIFRGDVPPGSAEKPLSEAKLKEMSGSNIFEDGKVESRDYFGGVRKPPGGESSIALV